MKKYNNIIKNKYIRLVILTMIALFIISFTPIFSSSEVESIPMNEVKAYENYMENMVLRN